MPLCILIRWVLLLGVGESVWIQTFLGGFVVSFAVSFARVC